MTTEKNVSQTFNNSGTFTNSNVLQGDNRMTINTTGYPGTENTLSSQEIISLIENIHHTLKAAGLPEDSKKKCLRHLASVKDEVYEDQPDKGFAAKGMKKVLHILKETGKVMGTDSEVPGQIEPVLERMLPWLGVDKDFFVL
jgi:hypothetical protein